jgi:hypothetical protein
VLGIVSLWTDVIDCPSRFETVYVFSVWDGRPPDRFMNVWGLRAWTLNPLVSCTYSAHNPSHFGLYCGAPRRCTRASTAMNPMLCRWEIGHGFRILLHVMAFFPC